MPFKGFNGSLPDVGFNSSEPWVPTELDVFSRPDVLIISLYVAVLTASLTANTLLIFIVIKFQYMRRWVYILFITSRLPKHIPSYWYPAVEDTLSLWCSDWELECDTVAPSVPTVWLRRAGQFIFSYHGDACVYNI